MPVHDGEARRARVVVAGLGCLGRVSQAMALPVAAGLLLLLLLSPQEAAATSYYLSSAGDDSSPGTSPATPWRTLGRVGELKLRVGDELLLRKGDSWIVESGDALVLRGASGLVSSYGNSTDTQPLIQVSSRGRWGACVRLYDATRLTVSGLRLTGCGAGVLVSQTLPETRDIAIERNVFADIRGVMQKFLPAGSSAPQPWTQDWGTAVALAALNTSTAPTKTVNLTVANNVAVRIDQFYTNTQPGPGWNDGKGTQRMSLSVEGAAVRGNTVQACGYNCYEMGGTTHTTVSDNVFLRDTPPDMFVCECSADLPAVPSPGHCKVKGSARAQMARRTSS